MITFMIYLLHMIYVFSIDNTIDLNYYDFMIDFENWLNIHIDFLKFIIRINHDSAIISRILYIKIHLYVDNHNLILYKEKIVLKKCSYINK